jgi:hypothetical protein
VSGTTLARLWGNWLGEGQNVAGSETQESVVENCEYLVAWLKHIPGCRTVSNNNTDNGWMRT